MVCCRFGVLFVVNVYYIAFNSLCRHFLKELKFLFIKDAEAKVTAEAFNVTRDFY